MSEISRLKLWLISLLRRTEKYTKTDMVYLASGTFWSNFNAGIVTILAFIASVFFARYLSKETYGNYQYVLSIAGLIAATTLTGMNSAVTRAVARGHEGELKHSVRYQLIAGIIPAVIGLGVSIWYLYHGNTALATAFALIAVFLPLSSAFNTWVAYVGGKKLFRVGSYYGLANNLAAYVPMLFAIYFGRNFLWIVFVNYLFGFLSSFIIYRMVIHNIPPNDKRDNETIAYGTHLSLMGIFGAFAGQFDSLLVFHFVGSAALAVYSFATVIPERLTGLLKFIPNIAMPKLAEKTEEQVKQIIAHRFWLLMALLAAAAGGYALLSPLLFHIFFPTYGASIAFTQVYSLSFFTLAATVITTALTAQRKTKELYAISFANPAVRIALMAVLMFYYGIWGLLWAQIINNFISLALQIAVFFWKKPAPQNI